MFKPKSDAINIGTDQIKIPCRNGLQFTQDQEIVFDIPRNVGFADMANAYVEVDVKIENPNASDVQALAMPMLQFDRVSGASSCINQMTVRSEGRLIEQLYPYNTYSQVHYNATEDEGMLNKRTRLEGCAKTYNLLDNPYIVPNNAVVSDADPITNNIGQTTQAEGWKYVTRKVCLPLQGGIFTNTRSHPCMAVPLTVHLLLEKAARCLRLTDCPSQVPTPRTPAAGVAGSNGPGSMPCENGPAAGQAETNIIYISARHAFSGIGGATAAGSIAALNEGENTINKMVKLPLHIGQFVQVSCTRNGVLVEANFRVHQIGVVDNTAAANQNQIVISFADAAGAATNWTGAGAGNIVNASTEVTISVLANDGTLLPEAGALNYTWTEPRLVIPKVVPPPQMVSAISRAIAKGQYNMDIISWSSYQNAIPSSQTASTNIIPADLSRCKAIISIPTSQASLDSLLNSNAICGQFLNADNYQYSVNNRLVPDRRVDLTREQFPVIQQHDTNEIQAPYQLGQFNSGFHIHETQKALENANIGPRNLSFLTLNDAAQTMRNSNRSGSWIIARSLGAGVGTSENLIGKSVILYLNYSSTVVSNMVKLLHNYVVHVRTLSVGMNGVEIFY